VAGDLLKKIDEGRGQSREFAFRPQGALAPWRGAGPERLGLLPLNRP
jgi:hypothetical protein